MSNYIVNSRFATSQTYIDMDTMPTQREMIIDDFQCRRIL